MVMLLALMLIAWLYFVRATLSLTPTKESVIWMDSGVVMVIVASVPWTVALCITMLPDWGPPMYT